MAPETWDWTQVSGAINPRSSHTKDSKIVFDASLLNTQHYKVRIKGKVEHPGKGVAPSPTL